VFYFTLLSNRKKARRYSWSFLYFSLSPECIEPQRRQIFIEGYKGISRIKKKKKKECPYTVCF